MALEYGFYNAELKNGEFDRTYDAEDFGEIFDGMISDGVFKGWGDEFRVTKIGTSSVSVGTGRAWLNGTWNVNKKPLTIGLQKTSPIVAITIKVDKTQRMNYISTPVFGNEESVVMTNDNINGIYQYCLAYVKMSNGVITSVESHVGQGTKNVTPWVRGLLGNGGSGINLDASAYTTGIKFKGTSGFDLTFKDSNGLTYVNNFTISETAGKISTITNKSTGRSITIRYE